jgi:hypothetical protein
MLQNVEKALAMAPSTRDPKRTLRRQMDSSNKSKKNPAQGPGSS